MIRIQRGDLSPLSPIDPVDPSSRFVDSSGFSSGISLSKVNSRSSLLPADAEAEPYEFVSRDARMLRRPRRFRYESRRERHDSHAAEVAAIRRQYGRFILINTNLAVFNSSRRTGGETAPASDRERAETWSELLHHWRRGTFLTR